MPTATALQRLKALKGMIVPGNIRTVTNELWANEMKYGDVMAADRVASPQKGMSCAAAHGDSVRARTHG